MGWDLGLLGRGLNLEFHGAQSEGGVTDPGHWDKPEWGGALERWGLGRSGRIKVGAERRGLSLRLSSEILMDDLAGGT